jgi:type III secretion system FlhB-like substrate exporter
VYKSDLRGDFSEREIRIIQKAKSYGVDSLSNEKLARELFNLKFTQEFSTEKIQGLLKFYRACDKSVEVAQMSS